MIHQRYPNAAATQKGRNFFTLPRGQWLAMPDLPVKLPMAAIKLAESDQRAEHPDCGTADPHERRNQSRGQWLRRVIDRADGRTFVYRARVSELDMRRKAISGVIRNLFRGNPSEVVGQILSERDVGEADLARMRAMIEDARSAERRKARKRHDDD